MNGSSHPNDEKHFTGDFCEHFPIQDLPGDTMGQFPVRETGS